VLHWFNPLVWLAFHRMRSDRELACDAFVLSRTQGEGTKDYGRAILSMVERFSIPQSLPGMAGILENRSQLKRRIAMITQFKNNSYQWSPLAVILILILACVSLLDAKHTKASESAASQPTHQTTFKKIRIPSKPDNGVLSPDGKRLAFVSKGSIWVVL
jgi:bla regulator protein BlaR1